MDEHPLKTFLFFCVTRVFSILFTGARHLALSFHLPLDFLSGLLPSGYPSGKKKNSSLQKGATCSGVSVWSLQKIVAGRIAQGV